MTNPAPVPLSDRARTLLDGPVYACFATIGKDGAPHLSTMWVTRDGETVLISTLASRQKAFNLRRDPRVSVMLIDPEQPYRYAEIRGTATMFEQGGRELIDRLSNEYTGHDYPVEPDDAVRVVVSITPTRITEWG